jgi:hypothetical protein
MSGRKGSVGAAKAKGTRGGNTTSMEVSSARGTIGHIAETGIWKFFSLYVFTFPKMNV